MKHALSYLLAALTLTAVPVLFAADKLEEKSAPQQLEVKLFEVDAGLYENVYLLFDSTSKQGVIIDPGAQSAEMEKEIEKLDLTIVGILNTHGHGDHKGANAHYREKYKTDVYAHETEKPLYNGKNTPTQWFSGDELEVGSFKIKTLHTPGHTPGGTCYLIGTHLFSGDTLMHEMIGKTRNLDIRESMLEHIRNKLMVLPDETRMHPGHGEQSTMGREKRMNGWLQEE